MNSKLVNDILGLNNLPPRETEKNRFGAMIYDHKTGGTCQVMTGDAFSNWKSYQPTRHGRSAVKKAGGINTSHI